MLERCLVALSLALIAGLAYSQPALAAKGPDAGAVSAWTAVGIVVFLAILSFLYGVRTFIAGGPPALPEEEPAGDHH